MLGIAWLKARTWCRMPQTSRRDEDVKPRAYVAHRIRGRLRLRIPERKNDEAYLEEVRWLLVSLPGDIDACVRAETASVVLCHPSAPYESLRPRLLNNDLFELVEAPPPPRYALSPLISGVSRLDRLVAAATSGSVDLRAVLFIAAVGLAIRQLTRGELLGPGVPLLWIALELAGAAANSTHGAKETAVPRRCDAPGEGY